MDLEDRLTGRFYTPPRIVRHLSTSGLMIERAESICEPFCGDGRLIVGWLWDDRSKADLLALKRIAIWDIDAEAVETARASISVELQRLGMSHVDVDARVIDTFAHECSDKFDLVLTNPPWEQLKPDARDGVRASAEYKLELRSYATRIARCFPKAATCPRRSIGGYTVNLARAGALAASSFVRDNGALAIVLPSTIFGDQVSGEFRERFFQELSVDKIDYFPASTRAFPGVDQGFVTIHARKGAPTTRVRLSRMKADLALGDVRELDISRGGSPLPLAISGKAQALTELIQSRNPALPWLEDDLRFGLKLGREVDETRISDALGGQGMPFVRGRNMARYRLDTTELPRLHPDKRRLPSTVLQPRVAWRDISNPAQKRRMHAAIIPANHVTGNSLGIASLSAGDDESLAVLMAVFNSLVFEIQVRGRLATNHISQGALRHCAVPERVFEDADLRGSIAKTAVSACSHRDAEIELEVMLAKSFGLSRDEFGSLLGCFDKVSADEAESMLTRERWA